MRIRHTVLSGLFLILVMITLACLPSSADPTPELPGGPVQVSEEASRRLESKVAEALQQSPSSQFFVTITDEELTSWVALRAATESGAMIDAPQIRFTQGKIFTAITVVGVLPINVRITLVSSVNVVDDRVQFEIEKSSAGPFPVPDFVLDALSQTINETLLEAQLDVTVTGIEILESEIVIAGQIRT
jgi:hypothetical protein